MQRLAIWCLRVALCGLAGCMLVGCSGDDTATRKGRPPAPVRISEVSRQTIPLLIDGVGYVAASNSVAVRSRIMGQLMEVRFAEGDDVKEGQVLFVLDERPYAAALREARARLARDRAQLLKARDDMRRFQSLSSKGYASQEQYEQARTDAAALQASVMADEAAVEQAELQLAYCTITAPISGRAGAVVQTRGNLIKGNDDTPMLTIDAIEPVYAYFSVPEGHLPDIRRRAQQGTLQVVLTPQGAGPKDTVSAELALIDNTVDQRTGTIRLRATTPNTDRLLWPGQFVTVKLMLGEQADALTVPAAAVLNGPGGSYVYVIDSANKAQYREVKTGPEHSGQVLIRSGLESGEKVVSEGQVRLGTGVPVQVLP